MPRPRPPNRIEPLSCPVFGLSWWADPASGLSILAACGGGGSAKTGVDNFVRLQIDDDPIKKISTGSEVGVSAQIYADPIQNKVQMVVALGTSIQRYNLPDGEDAGRIDTPDSSDLCNAVAVNAMANRVASGHESGVVYIYELKHDLPTTLAPLYRMTGHEKAVTALSFSLHGHKLVSSAKDGTARVWNSQDGSAFDVLECSIDGAPPIPGAKKTQKNRPAQILVRGCAFCDLQGKVILTVASGRRGHAFLYRWVLQGTKYNCEVRTITTPCPISAMSISQDASILSLGSVEGSVILWDIESWAAVKTWQEVHELPVTCIGARPYPVPLKGEEDGVRVAVRSASADSQLACLTLQKRAPKQPGEGGGLGEGIASFATFLNRLLVVVILLWILSPIWEEAKTKCNPTFSVEGLGPLGSCVLHEVLVAPASRPGISVPPY